MSDRSSEGYTGEGYVRRPPDPHRFDFQTAELIVERFKKAFHLSADVKTIDDVVTALDGRLWSPAKRLAEKTDAERVVLGQLHVTLGLVRPLSETDTIEKMVAVLAADDEALTASVAEDERDAVLREIGSFYGFVPHTVDDFVAEIDKRMEALELAAGNAVAVRALAPDPEPEPEPEPEHDCPAPGAGGWHSEAFDEGYPCKWCGQRPVPDRVRRAHEGSAPLEEKDRAEAAALIPGVQGVATKPRDSTQRGVRPQAPKGPAAPARLPSSIARSRFLLAVRGAELQLAHVRACAGDWVDAAIGLQPEE